MKIMKYKLLFITLLVCGIGWGQLLQWKTFGNTGNETTEPSFYNDTNISTSNLTQGTITPAGNSNRFGGSGWFNTGNTSTGSTLSEAIAGNDYIQFIVTPNSGYNFTVTSFVFQWDKSGTGPKNIALRSSLDNYSTSLGEITTVAALGTNNTIAITTLNSISSSITFRIYGYGSTVTTGTGGFDVSTDVVNVQLNGTTALIPLTSTTYTTSWSNSAPTASIDAIIAGNLTTTTDLACKDLTINSGNTLIIGAGKKLTVAGNLINNGSIVFKSDASGTAMFDVFNGTQSGTGVVTAERYIPARRAFRFVSSPVTTTTTIKQNWQENAGTTAGLGTHITGTGGATNGFDVTGTNNPSMYTFTNGAWAAVTNTNVNVLTAGTPYRLMVRGDRTTDLTTNTPTPTVTTLRATGTLKTGSFSPTINQTADGYSLIGNPYQAPIDIKAILTAASNMNAGVVYYWDPTLNTRGGYVTRDLTTDLNDVTSGFNQYVQPGQAVFVKRDNTANAASVTITESHKSVANGAAGVFRTTTPNDFGLLRVNLQANTNNQWQNIEGTLALFNDNFSWNVTPEDATKMSNLDEEVSFVQNNTSLAIACLSAPNANSELPIQMNNLRQSNYQWQFELANYQGERPYLYDAQNNTYTEITNGVVVPFTTTTAAANRFKIVFQPSALSTDDFANGLVVYPNPAKAGASFFVQGITAAQVTVYNVLGQNIPVQVKSQGNALQVTPTQTLSQGIYLVTLTTEGKTQQVKWIVE